MPLVDHKNYQIDGCFASVTLSHFMVDGEYYLNEACYSYFDYEFGEEDVETIVVFFFKRSRKHRSYVDWVINKSEFSSYYSTKDVDEGFANGFEVNWCGDYDNFIDALRMIRMTNEFALPLKKYSTYKGVHQYIQAILEYLRDNLGRGHTLELDGANSFARFIRNNKQIKDFRKEIKCVD